MQKLRIAFLMGAAVIGSVYLGGPAAAETIAHKSADTHVIVFRLPDGSIERIRYAGNRAPQVRIVGLPASAPGFFDPFWTAPPIANLDSISAALDREAATMLQQADSVMKASSNEAIADGLPAGVEGYSVVSTLSGNGVCTHSFRYTGNGDGKPHVESNTSGNCAPGKAASAPIQNKAHHPALKAKMPGIIQVNAEPAAAGGVTAQPGLRLASAVN